MKTSEITSTQLIEMYNESMKKAEMYFKNGNIMLYIRELIKAEKMEAQLSLPALLKLQFSA